MSDKKRVSSISAIAFLCAALGTVALATGAQAASRHFDGTVLAKDAAAKTVKVRTESGAKITFKVDSKTEFERISGGFGGLATGMRIEIDATKADGTWIARQIEPQGGGGGDHDGGGDDHGGGHDGGPNHG